MFSQADLALIEKFIATIPVKQTETMELFVIGFLGIIGMGKSTVANRLGERLDIYVASTDNVKRFLNDHGHKGVIPYPELSHQINMDLSQYLYDQNLSHIIDGDLTRFHGPARENATKNGAKLMIVDIYCDESVILERLKERDALIEKFKEVDRNEIDFSEIGSSLSGTEDYLARKQMYKTIDKPTDIYYTIDTSSNSLEELDSQLDELIEIMKGDGMIAG